VPVRPGRQRRHGQRAHRRHAHGGRDPDQLRSQSPRALNNLGGVAFSNSIASAGAAIYADTVNKAAEFQWLSVGVVASAFFFSFIYQVL
jgi:hypothetical protein